jgi:Glucose-6-phosphate dehydrogenase, NAD binding domain
MSTQPSDALVFFGATGDLAHKMIFPALQALTKSGLLDVPVIGVAKAGTWGLPAANTLIARDARWHDPAPSTRAAKEGGSHRASR